MLQRSQTRGSAISRRASAAIGVSIHRCYTSRGQRHTVALRDSAVVESGPSHVIASCRQQPASSVSPHFTTTFATSHFVGQTPRCVNRSDHGMGGTNGNARAFVSPSSCCGIVSVAGLKNSETVLSGRRYYQSSVVGVVGRAGACAARDKSTVALRDEDHDDQGSQHVAPNEGGQQARDEQRAGNEGSLLRRFLLTDIGEGIMEVEILQWFVGPGDRVRQFDKLCEVQSDKANVEITSRYDGVVRKIHHGVGEMAQTGCVLVDIEETTAAAADAESYQPFSSVEHPPTPTVTTETHGRVSTAGGERGKKSTRIQVLATPAVRRLSRDLKLDLDLLPPGTGAAGRVLKGDVLAYASINNIPVPSRELADIDNDKPAWGLRGGGSERGGSTPDNKAGTPGKAGSTLDGEYGQPAGISNQGDEEPIVIGALYGQAENSSISGVSGDEDGLPRWSGGGVVQRRGVLGSPAGIVKNDEQGVAMTGRVRPRERKNPVAVPIRGVQRAMMEAMRKALEVPHMTFCDEITADRLALLRSDLKEAAERRGTKLSYMPLIVKATSMALTAYPALNASLSECKSQLLQHPDHNIGVAMDTEKGLLVPNISAVQERSIIEIAEELNMLQRLGAAGKLSEAELTGTTFTLSNIGSIGGTYASPVILHPQVCIGALGRMQRVPRFDPNDPGKVIGVSVIPVSWSADHRVIEGGTLARFSNLWKAYLENPARMLADTR